MLRLYERIAVACATRQIKTLANLYNLVRPYAFTDQQAFKFDLFALDSTALDKLEEILLQESAEHTNTQAELNSSPADLATRKGAASENKDVKKSKRWPASTSSNSSPPSIAFANSKNISLTPAASAMIGTNPPASSVKINSFPTNSAVPVANEATKAS
jgi:hypothetical protein